MLAFGIWFLISTLLFSLSLSLWRCGKGFETICMVCVAESIAIYVMSGLAGSLEIGWIGFAIGFVCAMAGCIVFWYTLEEVQGKDGY